MSTINEAYINALLADATYAISNGGSITVEDNRNSLDASLTISQAKFIADNFEIVSHFESDDKLGSGFDATAWRGKAEPYTGQVYLSMRGTSGLADFFGFSLNISKCCLSRRLPRKPRKHFLAWQKPPNPPPKHAVTCLPSSPAAS